MTVYKVVCKPCEVKDNATKSFCTAVQERVGDKDNTVTEFCTTVTKDWMDGKLSAEDFAKKVLERLEPLGLKDEEVSAILKETMESVRRDEKMVGEDGVNSPEAQQLGGGSDA